MKNTAKILCHKYNPEKVLNDIDNWKIDNKIKKKAVSFMKRYSTGEITHNIIGSGSIVKYTSYLKIATENINSFDVKSVSKFKDDLIKGNINNTKEENFSLKSIKEILTMLTRFIEIEFPDRLAALKPVLDVNIKVKKTDIETLSDDEAEMLINEAKTIDKKYMLEMLNNAGMRAEEFHNIRYSDIILPKGNEMYVKVVLRNEFSKTEGRTISIFGKNTLKIIKEYLAKRLNAGMKPEDPVFPISYYSTRKWLQRHGKKVLKKRVYYHIFRHTAATRLCSMLNRTQLCVYFGWKFSSPMPDIYIKRSGVDMIDVEEKFQNTDFENMKKEQEKSQKQVEDLQAKIKSLLTKEQMMEIFNQFTKDKMILKKVTT